MKKKKMSPARRRALAAQRRHLAALHGSAYKGKRKGKRKVSAYNRFVGRHMKAGKTMSQAAALYKRQAGGSYRAPQRRERGMVLWEPAPLVRRPKPRKTIMLTRKQVAEIRSHVSKMVSEAKKVQRAKMAGDREAEKEAKARLKAAEKQIKAIRAQAVKDIRALTKAANLRGKHAPTAVKAAGYTAQRQPTREQFFPGIHVEAPHSRVYHGAGSVHADGSDDFDASGDFDYEGDMNSGLKAFQKFLKAQKRAGKSHKAAVAAWHRRGKKKPAAKKRSSKKSSFKKPAAKRRGSKKSSFKKPAAKRRSSKKHAGMTRAQKSKINKAKHRAKQAKLKARRDF